MLIISQNGELVVNNYDFIDIEECAATELEPSLTAHFGDVSRRLGAFKNRDTAAKILLALTTKIHKDFVHIPLDNDSDVASFVRNLE